MTILYLCVSLVVLALSITGHLRLLHEVGDTFGGFFWAIADGEVVFVSTPSQLPPLEVKAQSLTSNAHIVATDKRRNIAGLTYTYQHTHPGNPITYTILQNNQFSSFTRPAAEFTFDMWWENYGLALLAGISWLVVSVFLLATATQWTRAVEGITLFPVAMLLLLYSHWGNVQLPYQSDMIIQFLWTPSFALLGAAFIHLSLTYRPEALNVSQTPCLNVDGLPYLPLIALIAYEWGSFIIAGHVSTSINFLLSLGYGAIGGLLSFGIGINSLIQVWFSSSSRSDKHTAIVGPISIRIGDYLTLWIGGLGLGFCLGVLPVLLTGKLLLPLPVFYILAAIYPFIFLYAIRVLRLRDRLQMALIQQRKIAEELLVTNQELQQATSLLLHADTHLRSLLSQRIHDQPKQQALRILALLGYWQHELRAEIVRNSEGKMSISPMIGALEKVSKISEELVDDLRGLQLLVEDVYQRRSLGLKLHLENLIREDLPALHPESSLTVQVDLGALDALGPDLEKTEEGVKIAEAVSYTVTQALLNVYNHADATLAMIRALYTNGVLEIYIVDDGCGFDPNAISPQKISLFKARLKAREAGGIITIQSVSRSEAEHGTTILLRIPVPLLQRNAASGPLLEAEESGTRQDQKT